MGRCLIFLLASVAWGQSVQLNIKDYAGNPQWVDLMGGFSIVWGVNGIAGISVTPGTITNTPPPIGFPGPVGPVGPQGIPGPPGKDGQNGKDVNFWPSDPNHYGAETTRLDDGSYALLGITQDPALWSVRVYRDGTRLRNSDYTTSSSDCVAIPNNFGPMANQMNGCTQVRLHIVPTAPWPSASVVIVDWRDQ